MYDLRQDVRDFRNEASYGERLLPDNSYKSGYLGWIAKRYSLEPYVESFTAFYSAGDQEVLEIGVGPGAARQRFAQEDARLTRIDPTDCAVEHARRRFELFGLCSGLRVTDAEAVDGKTPMAAPILALGAAGAWVVHVDCGGDVGATAQVRL